MLDREGIGREEKNCSAEPECACQRSLYLWVTVYTNEGAVQKLLVIM